MILIDSSVWIDYLNDTGTPHSAALQALISDGSEICLADVNLMEVLQGIKTDRLLAKVKKDLLSLRVLAASDVGTFVHAAEIYRTARRAGVTVASTIDLIVAAIAMENDATVLHHDADFERLAQTIPGLKTITPQAILGR